MHLPFQGIMRSPMIWPCTIDGAYSTCNWSKRQNVCFNKHNPEVSWHNRAVFAHGSRIGLSNQRAGSVAAKSFNVSNSNISTMNRANITNVYRMKMVTLALKMERHCGRARTSHQRDTGRWHDHKQVLVGWQGHVAITPWDDMTERYSIFCTYAFRRKIPFS